MKTSKKAKEKSSKVTNEAGSVIPTGVIKTAKSLEKKTHKVATAAHKLEKVVEKANASIPTKVSTTTKALEKQTAHAAHTAQVLETVVTQKPEHKKRGKKTVFTRYIVDGNEFGDIVSAASALKMTDAQVYNRLRSKSEKYKGWVRLDKSGKNPENKSI